MSNEFLELAASQIPEWYAYQLNPLSPVYNISFNHFFFNNIDPHIFVQVWQIILDRHINFRIRFTYRDGVPMQYLDDPIVLDPNTILIDRTSVPVEQITADQSRLAEEYGLAPFDFIKGPIFRLKLVIYAEKQYQLIFTVHHIIWDETSTLNLIKEFVEIYTARLQQRQPILPELTVNYFDYVQYTLSNRQSEDYQRQEKYWLSHFKNLPLTLELHTDFVRPAIITYDGETIIRWLPRVLVKKIQQFVTEKKTTLFIYYLSVLSLYFYRITGNNDLVLGCPHAGREKNEFQNLLGCFAVPLPIRCRLEKNMSFSEHLQNITTEVLNALENSSYPCVKFIEKLHHVKDLSRAKLFSIMAGVQNNKSEYLDIQLGEGRLYSKDIFSAENSGARFDIAIGLDPFDTDIKFFSTFNKDLFRTNTIESLMESVSHLFSETINKPFAQLSEFSLTSDNMQRELLVFSESNMLGTLDQPLSIVELFEKQVSQFPQQIAIQHMDIVVTYAELNSSANQLAHLFVSKGFNQKSIVGVLLEPSVDLIITLLAIIKLGVCYIPITSSLPIKKVNEIFQQSNCDTCVMYTPQKKDSDLSVNNIIYLDQESEIVHQPKHNLSQSYSGDNVMYIIFTSGTTGKPKGIPIQYQAVVSLLYSIQNLYGLHSQDKTFLLTPISFDASILEIYWPLCFGGQIVIPANGFNKTAENIWQNLSTYHITLLQTVPILLNELSLFKLMHPVEIFLALRLVICGGSYLTRANLQQAKKVFNCKIANHYGPTEVTVDALTFDGDHSFLGDIVPLGRPLSHMQVFILDEFQNLLPKNTVGEICLASNSLTPGYLNDEFKNKKSFITKTFSIDKSLRLYRTGDIGKMSDTGVIYFFGRKDNQVKINGNRIELEGIEAVLDQHPSVSKSVVKIYQDANGINSHLSAYVKINDAKSFFTVQGSTYQQYTLRQMPYLYRLMLEVHLSTWPRYFEGSSYVNKYWHRLYSEFSEYQFCLLDAASQVAAVANGIPLYWDGSLENVPGGWDAAIELAFTQHEQGINPNTLLGLAGAIPKTHQGKGLSSEIVRGFRKLAKIYGLAQFLGPVRPVGMFEQGIQDVTTWAKACDKAGLPLDYWLRVHTRMGAKIVGVALESQRVEGTLAQWQEWTQQQWQYSGEYLLPTTLQAIHVDIEKNSAYYYDPSIWVAHYGLQEQVHNTIKEPIDVFVLRDFLLDHLPSYMIPDKIFIVAQMLLTESGKVDLQALPELDLKKEQLKLAPQTDIQKNILPCWTEILNIAGISIDDDFFFLGGQSLQAIRMLAEIEKKYGFKIALRDFYRYPTIIGLSSFIENSINHLEQ